jgi:hypothetical protein
VAIACRQTQSNALDVYLDILSVQRAEYATKSQPKQLVCRGHRRGMGCILFITALASRQSSRTSRHGASPVALIRNNWARMCSRLSRPTLTTHPRRAHPAVNASLSRFAPARNVISSYPPLTWSLGISKHLSTRLSPSRSTITGSALLRYGHPELVAFQCSCSHFSLSSWPIP